MTLWKSLLLIYPSIDVKHGRHRKRLQRFAHALTELEIRDAIESFRRFPWLVEELTSERAGIEFQINRIDRSLNSLTQLGQDTYWPSPDDTRAEIDRFAPPGAYDSLFVLWPQQNFANGTSVPSGGWGLAIAASPWSNHATYAAVANVESSKWQVPVVGEVWLHEWLHGACAFFSSKGFLMPDGDADGGERHGYIRSPISGWTAYYRDLMSGNVLENGKRTGIPFDAWQAAPLRGDDK